MSDDEITKFTRRDVIEALMAQTYQHSTAGTIAALVDFEQYPVLGSVGDKGPAFQGLLDELEFGIAWMSMNGRQALIINPYENTWDELGAKLKEAAREVGIKFDENALSAAPAELPGNTGDITDTKGPPERSEAQER